jgi:hypothetical protein
MEIYKQDSLIHLDSNIPVHGCFMHSFWQSDQCEVGDERKLFAIII